MPGSLGFQERILIILNISFVPEAILNHPLKKNNILLVILHVKTCQNSIEPTGVYQPLLVHFRSHHPGIFHGDPFRGSDIGAKTQPGDGWRMGTRWWSLIGYAVYHWDLHGFMMVYGDSNLYSVNEEIKTEPIEDASFWNMKNDLLLLVTYNDLTTLWTDGQGNDFQAPPWPRKVLPSPRALLSTWLIGGHWKMWGNVEPSQSQPCL